MCLQFWDKSIRLMRISHNRVRKLKITRIVFCIGWREVRNDGSLLWEKDKAKKTGQKTYNSRYSLVVTHPTTNLPI
jgi:hypothetical protein